MYQPLGAHEQLSAWSGKANSWGGDTEGSATFGGGVVENLVELIRAFPSRVRRRFPGKAEAVPVALGCVPWFTSVPVAKALVDMGPHCICVGKTSSLHSDAVKLLLERDQGIYAGFIPALEFVGPRSADGSPPLITPAWDPEFDGASLGPVRVAGWAERKGARPPILHAKLLVLGAAWEWENEGGGYSNHFTPMVTWFGSANWTRSSRLHVETGVWTTDTDLATNALGFMVDLVRLSESPSSAAGHPEPDLAHADWDDQAFADLYAELHPDEIWEEPLD